ncbi:unnamed protein product [Schistocephalus solidus]|uniref:Reverse transcriptase domain-containing protein n=1 Tax=Schistocephalus solidus TaxID=70667 RepID=A0A183SKQ2_SCHSO|nr:unnamed protein product [Schistocephalus solidus]
MKGMSRFCSPNGGRHFKIFDPSPGIPSTVLSSRGSRLLRISYHIGNKLVNVLSFPDNPKSNRSEQRTALVARELAHYKVDVAALSETRFSEQCQLWDLQEKCQEMRTHLYTTFVDLTKAFDMVNRDGLWKVMQKFGCPERFTHMVRQLHDKMTPCVTDNGTVSLAFALTNGVKHDDMQRCIHGFVVVDANFGLTINAT